MYTQVVGDANFASGSIEAEEANSSPVAEARLEAEGPQLLWLGLSILTPVHSFIRTI